MLLTDEYRSQLQRKHQNNENWGTTSHRYGDFIATIINQYSIHDILDYGCGKGTLKNALNTPMGLKYREYDPGIKGKDKVPKPSQMVVCTDVLEHVEPKCLASVLDDLLRVTKQVGFFDICTVAAVHTLPDGRNAHLIVESMDWWLPKVMQRFKLKALQDNGTGFWMLVEPR
jgi:hypothetical protein